MLKQRTKLVFDKIEAINIQRFRALDQVQSKDLLSAFAEAESESIKLIMEGLSREIRFDQSGEDTDEEVRAAFDTAFNAVRRARRMRIHKSGAGHWTSVMGTDPAVGKPITRTTKDETDETKEFLSGLTWVNQAMGEQPGLLTPETWPGESGKSSRVEAEIESWQKGIDPSIPVWERPGRARGRMTTSLQRASGKFNHMPEGKQEFFEAALRTLDLDLDKLIESGAGKSEVKARLMELVGDESGWQVAQQSEHINLIKSVLKR